MANPNKRLPENAPGDFFVDSTCIDCDTCRQLAPAVFAEGDGHAFVHRQPATEADRRHALRALVCCPTGSIGTLGADRPAEAMDDFPRVVEEPVSYCGFTSSRSYGGSSYFVRHPGGNWLIDSPKFLPRLVKRFEQLGSIGHIFLTQRDGVADAGRYARHFGGTRYIHRAELDAQPDAEVVLDGTDPRELGPGFVAIPTPGHAEGHCVLLFENWFLFTGDHLDYDRHERRLSASPDYAGTPGRSKPRRWSGSWGSRSTGCCPGTGSGSTRPRRRCGGSSRNWSGGCGPEPGSTSLPRGVPRREFPLAFGGECPPRLLRPALHGPDGGGERLEHARAGPLTPAEGRSACSCRRSGCS